MADGDYVLSRVAALEALVLKALEHEWQDRGISPLSQIDRLTAWVDDLVVNGGPHDASSAAELEQAGNILDSWRDLVR